MTKETLEKEEHPGLLDQLKRRMTHLVDDFSVRGPGRLGADGSFIPRVDLEESETEIAVSAELPGIEPGELSVNFFQGMLEIRGEKREEKRTGWWGRRSVERRYGFFRRVVALPEEAEMAEARARFRNGVLTVTFPKKPEALAGRQRIEIATEEHPHEGNLPISPPLKMEEGRLPEENRPS